MRAAGSRWRLLLVLLAALALACRGQKPDVYDPITDTSSTSGFPKYEPVPGGIGQAKTHAKQKTQRRDKMSGRSQAREADRTGRKKMMSALFGDSDDGPQCVPTSARPAPHRPARTAVTALAHRRCSCAG